MATDNTEILTAAGKLGDLLAGHPAIARYKEAQRLVTADPEASRLLAEFDRELDGLARLEQSGVPVSDAQQMKLQQLQSRIVSHIQIKNLNLAQVEFYDLLRKVQQAWLKPLGAAAGGGGAGGGAGGGGGASRIVGG